MTQFEMLTLWISAIHASIALLVGGGQCLLIVYGLKLMQRGTEKREEQSKRLHEETMTALETRHRESMRALETLIERTSK